MALNELQQIEQLIRESKYILILANSKSNGDALSSALALKTLLDKQQKQADIVASDFTAPKHLSFLPGLTTIKPTLAHLQKFIIKVDVTNSQVETLSYDIKDNTLSIYITPKQGILSKNELRTAQSSFKYDLIITLGTPDLESLGTIFYNNTDLFYKTAIVNFDYQPSNERYGQVNMVDVTATSVAETVYKTIKKIYPEKIDNVIATALLTGMTIATQSFKNHNITPFTLQLASELINYGAERELIVQNLYRTRSVAALKLWGQALIHLQYNADLGLVSTSLTREDFTRTGATADDLNGIIDELISNAPEAKLILVLHEVAEKKIAGMLTTEKGQDALTILKPLNPQGTKKNVNFTIEGKTLKEAEEEIIALIKK